MLARLLDAISGCVEQQEGNSNAATTDCQSRVILPSQRFALPTPLTVQSGCNDQNKHSEIISNPVSVFDLANARVFFNAAEFSIRSADGSVVLEKNLTAERAASLDWQSHRLLPGTTLLLTERAGANCYYHWMLDFLPRIGLLRLAGIELSAIDQLSIRHPLNRFQSETLSRIGVEKRQVTVTGSESYLQCERLIHIELDNFINFYMHDWVVNWVKDNFSEPPSFDQPQRLYLQRPAGVRRAVSNEPELQPVLKKYGFTTVAMEGLTVAKQAALLGSASVVVAPHGGALTNMVFSPPGTQIVELFGKLVMPFYYGLSALCRHQYHAIIEDSQDYARLIRLHEPLRFSREQLQEDFYVRPDWLDQSLETIFNQANLDSGGQSS